MSRLNGRIARLETAIRRRYPRRPAHDPDLDWPPPGLLPEDVLGGLIELHRSRQEQGLGDVPPTTADLPTELQARLLDAYRQWQSRPLAERARLSEACRKGEYDPWNEESRPAVASESTDSGGGAR